MARTNQGGTHTIYGTEGNDTLNGSDAYDLIYGGAGDDYIDGKDGIDTLYESADVNFTLTNTSLTGLGNDTLANIEYAEFTGGNSSNIIDASAFTAGSVSIGGNDGNDTIYGGAGND